MIPIQYQGVILRKPGVYLFKDKKDRVIYVGKAIDLYHRVASYVNLAHPGSVRQEALVKEIVSVETIVVESELEALILEANLIKKYLPKFNIRLTDDKDYLYIKLTKENFPKVITTRKYDLKGSLKYFGPFPSSKTVRETLRALRKVFPWCSGKVQNVRPCFYYHLGLCPGPCVGEITKEEYQKIIKRLVLLLDGKKEKLLADLTKEMEKAAQKEQFEEASRIKKMLDGIAYLTSPNRAQMYLENPNFLEDQKTLALEQLQKALSLKEIPHRIEAYDISNMQGRQATGSLVVLTNGEVDKSQYRKFKIKIQDKPNDVAMMREILRRRLNHQEWQKPDLLLIDGGRGQVNGVKLEIGNLLASRSEKLEIPIYGLAKRMEWLYGENGEIIKLPKTSPALHLLQKIRDEAHRFALSYHRKLHHRYVLAT